MSTSAPLMLSVSGLRGIVGASLTPNVAANYAAALARWLTEQMPAGMRDPLHVVVGRDSRPSGAMVEHAVVAGLLAMGVKVTQIGIATTPGVAVMVQHLEASAGIVITASHNPIMWNGLKPIRFDASAPSASNVESIIANYRENKPDFVPVERIATSHSDPHSAVVHVARILDRINVEAIRKRKFKVVLESVHGAGGPSTALLLREAGVEFVHLYGEPTGRFPHTPEPTRENLVGLSAAMREHQADIGFAQDPDADRLAMVDAAGQYIGEEYTLALTALHVLSSRMDDEYDTPPTEMGQGASAVGIRRKPTIVTNLSTSRMVDDVAAKVGGTVARTPVGEANVASTIRHKLAAFGGEGNGGVIWPAITHVRDSLAGIALMLEFLATTDQTLASAVAALPAYAIVKDKVELGPGVNAAEMTAKMKAYFAGRSGVKLDEQDGLRVDWADRWVHVRGSNTEPIVRLIAEAPDESAARAVIRETRTAVGLK